LPVIGIVLTLVLFSINRIYPPTIIKEVTKTELFYVPGVSKITGDVDGNGIVDDRDLKLISMFFGKNCNDSVWYVIEHLVDLKKDGRLNVLDLSIVGMNFGAQSIELS